MEKSNRSLKNRDLYLKKLISFQDTEPVKVITGIRRCGKSSVMRLMTEHLKSQGKTSDQIIFMNFESMEYHGWTSVDLYNYVKKNVLSDRKMYLFFDEVQRVPDWQDAVNSFRVDFECDIYITGSNAYLLSSELSTYLAGRYVEIRMLPLSFGEFLYFHDYTVSDYVSPTGKQKKRVTDEKGEVYEIEDLLEAYMMFGGMPALKDSGLNQDTVLTILDGAYSTVIIRDILEREKRRGQRQITDAELLRKVVLFLADNIGNNVSATSISNTLLHERLLESSSNDKKPSVHTIQAYIASLMEAYFFYEIKRFDIKGKEYLKTLGKYYIVDLGFRNYLLGYRGTDTGHALENLVYFELLRKGYDVAIGKIGSKEIDFVVTKGTEIKYVQVTETFSSKETENRELSALREIKNNHEKIVIMKNPPYNMTEDGIRLVNIIDFLLQD